MDIQEYQQSNKQVKRVGMVIKIRPECVQQYLSLHQEGHPGFRDLLQKYHLRNFSIFLHKIGSDFFEFGYYEYTAASFESGMAGFSAEQRNIEWLKLCDPMQLPLEGDSGWAIMQQIYYND